MTLQVRTSAKALIYNSKGKILVVKDHGRLTLPGGATEDGESLEDALGRELREECCIKEPFKAREIHRISYKVGPRHNQPALWVVFLVEKEGNPASSSEFTISAGSGVEEWFYADPFRFARQTTDVARRIYACHKIARP